jgi:hypothetical protein
MQNITVRKTELIKRIEDNRSRHRALFEQACTAFQVRLEQELERRLRDVRAGRPVSLRIDLPEPEDHTIDYDRVLEMLALEVEEEVLLSETDVAQYVMDDWAWKRAFVTTNSSYGVG